MILVFNLVIEDVIYIGLNKRTEIGSSISAKNMLILKLEYIYNWTKHWESNSEYSGALLILWGI